MNPTSMAYWLPKIQHLPIRMPRTEMIQLEKEEYSFGYTENDLQRIRDAADTMGYPIFLKTDLCAAKHSYAETCCVSRKEDLESHLHELTEHNFLCDLYFGWICVREYIELASRFKAFKDMPIAPERRYFIKDGEVLCHHFYWPENAIEFFNVKIPDSLTDPEQRWEYRNQKREELKQENLPLLREMNRERPAEVALLTKYAQMVAEVLPGYWSVDFALARSGEWVLIDMAEGLRSWHPDDCPVKKAMQG